MEWANPYSSFNSWKGLSYVSEYRQIAKWLDGEGELPPPVECNLDPIAECNLRCYFCVVQRYLRNNREEVSLRKLPTDNMLRLVDFLVDWGVKGLCISGGGEPTLHDGLPKVIRHAKNKGMDVALVTNAVSLSADLMDSMMLCRWVALSVDSANADTYQAVKGRQEFKQVCANIEYLSSRRQQTHSKVDLCFKFLLLPENQREIYEACKLAKNLGVQDFHARPVDLERKDIIGAKMPVYNIPYIKDQYDACHKLETESFHVYTVQHKFDANFHVKKDIKRCLAAPLILPALTDGAGYLCVEHKMDANYKLGDWLENPENIKKWWGSDKHRIIIKGVVPSKDCSRCIYTAYHTQIEEAVIRDRMCLSFP